MNARTAYRHESQDRALAWIEVVVVGSRIAPADNLAVVLWIRRREPKRGASEAPWLMGIRATLLFLLNLAVGYYLAVFGARARMATGWLTPPWRPVRVC